MREMLGFEAPEGSEVVKHVSQACTDVFHREPNVGAIQPYMFITSDSGHMQAAGIADGALIGPGKFTSSVPDEYVEVSKIVAASKILLRPR